MASQVEPIATSPHTLPLKPRDPIHAGNGVMLQTLDKSIKPFAVEWVTNGASTTQAPMSTSNSEVNSMPPYLGGATVGTSAASATSN